ncbi:MAG: C4-type zinc ribbon domain-containing protein [Dehalococcoidia bacterium]|jgi:predicted  nucleic acid-binding Zn-ribbon protein
MSLAKRVFELHQIEQAILSQRNQADEIDLRLNHNSAYEKAREELSAAEQGEADLEGKYKELDAESEQLRNNIQRINDKLYGGKIKNPKELMSFEQEAAMLKSNLVPKDDLLLAMMERLESRKAEVQRLQELCKTIEAAWNKEKPELKVEREKVVAEVAKLEKKRKEIAEDIDSSALSAYEGIKGRKSQPVVRVEQGKCMGCRVTLSISELQRVRGMSIVTCSNCGRILYLS